MDVVNHRIDALWHKHTSNYSQGKTIKPRFIVMHYTTGWSAENNLAWLLGRAGGSGNTESSAHILVGRDGKAWQICPFNRRAWHAGPSRLGTVADLNSHAIGIELLNPGWLKPDGHGGWVDYHGNRRSTRQLQSDGGYLLARNSRVGSGELAWPLYTDAQLDTSRQICLAIARAYPIHEIVTHEEVDTRGWKTDPGPAFPLDSFRSLVDDYGRESAQPRYKVSASRLNLRGGPATSYELVDPPGQLQQGTLVEALRHEGDWAYVQVVREGSRAQAGATVTGWVHSAYLQRQW
ncbi:N-acetylmuramoyl-L-alanine amidase [Pseudoxanthomonas suwonensis]|uniref:N-acetylmuramoyl-L-alanine amidase n=1 Tax=Pseudoxanthomonas suwonensis TaxID=314722 RepID=A0A0E3Z2M1_9GAMM|nr:N-acetylmuramoyl-L-alanine amidase [Pseudoxanthomonas suwonensis]AKC87009.1 hypothetical protein WQ53_09890 [Pseudoxanthomonas suwonensis]